MDKQTEQLSFEEALMRLEKIVEQLESGETTLEQSLKLFEEGVKYVQVCTTKLDETEARVQILLERNKEIITETFATKEGQNDDEFTTIS